MNWFQTVWCLPKTLGKWSNLFDKQKWFNWVGKTHVFFWKMWGNIYHVNSRFLFENFLLSWSAMKWWHWVTSVAPLEGREDFFPQRLGSQRWWLIASPKLGEKKHEGPTNGSGNRHLNFPGGIIIVIFSILIIFIITIIIIFNIIIYIYHHWESLLFNVRIPMLTFTN